MEAYLKNYFELLINTADIEIIKTFLPTLQLDKTNIFIDRLLEMIQEEIELAIEVCDTEYKSHLDIVSGLLSSKKEKEENDTISLEEKNILIFSQDFFKMIKSMDDSVMYRDILNAINSLENKSWVENNKFNPFKYKRLHGEASGLFEVKVQGIRLLHMPINSDFWYISAVVVKEGDRKKKYNEDLIRTREDSQYAIEKIVKKFSTDNGIDYNGLRAYAEETSRPIMKELSKWEGKKNEK